MTEETREMCRKILDRCLGENEPMFTQPAPWWTAQTTQQTMTMRQFCHYLFESNQDAMLSIVQTNRVQRQKAKNAAHPYLYRKVHDEAAVKSLIHHAQTQGITITGTFRQQADSYGDYRVEHLNYKSFVKGKEKVKKMDIPVVNTPQSIPSFVSATEIDEKIKVAMKLTALDVEKKEAEARVKKIESEQRELVRQLSGK